jgi:hypothetical protein
MSQNVDFMWSAETADKWEELNRPDVIAEKLKEAALSITEGLDCINSGLDFVAEAVKTLEHYAMAEKVLSFLDDFEKLTVDLEILKDNYERGERD